MINGTSRGLEDTDRVFLEIHDSPIAVSIGIAKTDLAFKTKQHKHDSKYYAGLAIANYISEPWKMISFNLISS
jgi:hypothetical protein